MLYYPFIDGMRALAVLAVILFHYDLGVTGGYIGVDIFFVISGFLITSILMTRIADGPSEFFGHFYERRARRILPPLVIVAFFTVLGAWFLLLPYDMERFGKSLRNMAVFFSNFHFAREVGYFDAPAATKPLLHSWSLAVEEQFYLLFPPLLYLAWRALGRHLQLFGISLILLMLASLISNLYLIDAAPQKAFFLPHARAWELLMGSLVAIYGVRFTPRPRSATIITLLSLLVLLLCLFGYDHHTLFPGAAAIPPVLASAALIWANLHTLSTPARWLTWRPVVFVGLISYGLYLYHWPLLVFAQYYVGGQPSQLMLLAGLPLLFAFAWLSYRYIEQPVRRGRIFKTRTHALVASLIAILVMLGTGVAIAKANGLPHRFSKKVQHYAAAGDEKQFGRQCPQLLNIPGSGQFACVVGDGDPMKPEFLVWGDSHAEALELAMHRLSMHYKDTGWVMRSTGCPPLFDTERVDQRMDNPCITFNDEVRRAIKKYGIKDIIMVARWDMYTLGWEKGSEEVRREPLIDHKGLRGMEAFTAALPATLKELQAQGVRVWIMLQIPPQLTDVPTALANAEHFGRDKNALRRTRQVLDARHGPINKILRAQPNVRIIDTTAHFCLAGEELCRIEIDGESLYSDNDHVSFFGAQRLQPYFEPFFKSLR